ncbi:unnamed protein product [Cunninghamella blakesleeana]
MITDEREEGLREVCALGNIKAVQHYLQAGVKLNSQNKMNGWTALHWASHRGNDDIVRLLLSNGADITVKTNKGQTALDLCDKHPNVKAMLEAQHVETTDVGPEPELPIKATYLKEPDLEKSWLLPDEFSENKADRIIRQQTALDNLNNEKNNTNQQQPVKNTESSYNTSNISTKDIDENEILVYLKTKSDDAILGSVYLKNEPLNNIIQSLKNVSSY